MQHFFFLPHVSENNVCENGAWRVICAYESFVDYFQIIIRLFFQNKMTNIQKNAWGEGILILGIDWAIKRELDAAKGFREWQPVFIKD